MTPWVYFSSKSGTTVRLINKLGGEATRIPISSLEVMPVMEGPFVLICPSYGDGEGKNSIAKQVLSFLELEDNQRHMLGIVGIGDRNFGKYFAHASVVLSQRFNVSLMHKMEVFAFGSDMLKLREIEVKTLAAWKEILNCRH